MPVQRFYYVVGRERGGMEVNEALDLAVLVGHLRSDPAKRLARRIERHVAKSTAAELHFGAVSQRVLEDALSDARIVPGTGVWELRERVRRVRRVIRE